MKIAILNIYNGVIDRGSEVFVDELASNLSSNHEITVYQMGNAFQVKSYRVIKKYSLSKNIRQGFLYHLNVLFFTLGCMKSLFNENYDWIIPINGYFQVILCRLVRKFKKTKILISGHAGIGRDDKFNILYGRPDVFVALTQKAYSWAAKFYNHDKIKLIPNGVNLDMFSKKGGKAKIPLKTPIILCVSAYVRYKRLDLLIKAVEKVPMASLLLIGDGPLYDSLNKMGSDLLFGRFLSIKHICHEDMPLYYRSSNLFSLPSRESEAFGLVYLEAMASNIPIVGPSDNHRKELIGNAGMLCEVEDETKYSETLIKALQKDFDSLPEKQANKYSWQTVAIEYDSLFKSS